MITKIGVTERGDPALDLSWLPWVKNGNPTVLITKKLLCSDCAKKEKREITQNTDLISL